MELTPQYLRHCLARWPAVRRFWLAYSGGRDSHVLLHCVRALGEGATVGLRVVHVHHGLYPQADDWVRHCRQVCAGLGLELQVLRVDARAAAGHSPEAAAREARYQALAACLSAGDALLTAHHREDQAETVLLQLLRGAGPHGLAAMPAENPLGRGLHLRPLLACDRAALSDYAQRHGLQWIDDHSNSDLGFDRNYLRHRVLPALAERWPAWDATLARAADNNADAAALIDHLGASDLRQVATEHADQLDVPALAALEPYRQRNAVRMWLRGLALPAPSRQQLRHVLDDVLAARADAEPLVRWPGVEVRRYRQRLYAMAPLRDHDPGQCVPWVLDEPLRLPELGLRLQAVRQRGAGVRAQLCAAPVTVRFRCGGERLQPVGSRHRRSLKTLFQEHGIAPWQRARIPLLYVGDQLAAVGDLWIEQDVCAADDEWGYTMSMQPDNAKSGGGSH